MDSFPYHKSVEELTFTDDFMFGTIMKHKPVCKGVLERLLHFIFLDDRTTKVFYNASAYGKEKDDELHALLRYLCEKQATSHFTQTIDGLVESTKNNEKFRSVYMSLNIHRDDLLMAGEKIGFERGVIAGMSKGRRQGIADGSHQAKLETAQTMKSMRYPIADIHKITGLSIAEINKL